MKKWFMISLVFALTLALGFGVAFAGNGAPKGKHWGFNIIGHPKNVDAISGDHSNGRAIMVPLKNANGPGQPVIECEADQIILTDDLAPDYKDQMPTGAKIHFVPGDDFDIIDRDATDNNGATIMIPTTIVPNNDVQDPGDTDPDRVIAVDVYIRVLGKPMTCMDIDGYAWDMEQGLWFWSGSVDLNRKHGKSSFMKINEMFDVWFCQVDPVTDLCIAGTEIELSVFDNVFEDYFWNILNYGTRLVQVRLYPVVD